MTTGPKPRPVEDRFWPKVKRAGMNDCWLWNASRDAKGYGRIRVSRTRPAMLAHRVSYILANGEIEAEQNVLHKCDNPSCVNPKHLFLGTMADNTHDMVAKGRHYAAFGEQSTNHKLTDKQVVRLRAMYKTGQYTYRTLAAEFGMSHVQVMKIIKRVHWAHVP